MNNEALRLKLEELTLKMDVLSNITETGLKVEVVGRPLPGSDTLYYLSKSEE